MSASKVQPQQPGLVWRSASTFIMATTGMLWRSFLYGLNDVETVGLDSFLRLLDARKDVGARQRGLVTVSNHVSVIDDPLIWGVLPFRYAADHRNLRWSLGSHDICYSNSLLGHFFCAGQTLPTHRLRHSPWGGLFQPTLNQAVRLLSAQPLPVDSAKPGAPLETLASSSSSSSSNNGSVTPASSSFSPSSSSPLTTTTTKAPPQPPSRPALASSRPSPLYYSTNNADSWPAPSAYACNRHAWVHIFPEGSVHQQRDRSLRYFKWGIARLILESEPAPDVVPMFIDGPDRIMDEARTFPRFLPRVGRKVRIVFGDALGPEAFADLRDRWQRLVARSRADGGASSTDKATDLRYGAEARQLRIETASRMRDEVLKLRRRFGYPDEDPKLGLAEAWADEPNKKQFRSQVDDSMVYRE